MHDIIVFSEFCYHHVMHGNNGKEWILAGVPSPKELKPCSLNSWNGCREFPAAVERIEDLQKESSLHLELPVPTRIQDKMKLTAVDYF
ncbi:hypothetical protein BDA96_09G074100 [Sorghum bicolor]|uniref:Uncharacterized protein n=2 Tax=Sorghum bicolor TaxID=4558 RepID=A0A921Q838_SORBI|nr:hypothetical protein BDA96_09G074100 [Sorghum bicolor]OQU77572.1 hypothetical protein SORBI_3009G070066 [Sorghum bicolor]